jgi:probable rRNA maturation factor
MSTMIVLEYVTEVKTAFSRNFFHSVAELTLAECRLAFLLGREIHLNAIAVSANKIRKLNQTYRGKDEVTDILSFGEYAGAKALAEETKKEIFLGEIFFCPEFITKQSKRDLSRKAKTVIMKSGEKNKGELKREMAYIFSHGVLHLVGFNHGKTMFAIQEKVAGF